MPCPPDLAADFELKIVPEAGSTVRLWGSLRAVWPDQVRVQARAGPFLPVASIAVSADSAFVSLPRQGVYWAGIPRGVPGALDPRDVAANLLLFLCPGPLVARLVDPVLDRREDGWVLTGALRRASSKAEETGAEAFRSAQIGLSKDRRRIRWIQFSDAEGLAALRAWRAEERGVGDSRIAGWLRILAPGAGATANGTLIEIRLIRPRRDPNRPPDTFRIALGPKMRWINEEDLLALLSRTPILP